MCVRDWYNDSTIMKAIVQLYSKARAFAQLSRFFEASALMEIDEHSDYEKASVAFQEALKYAEKIKTKDMNASSSMGENPQLGIMRRKIHQIERFLEAKGYANSEPSRAQDICQQLLASSTIDEGTNKPVVILTGDIYGLSVQCYYAEQRHDKACGVIKEMQSKGIDLNQFIEGDIVQELLVTISSSASSPAHNEEDESSTINSVEVRCH